MLEQFKSLKMELFIDLHPNIAKELNLDWLEENHINLQTITPSSRKKVPWTCNKCDGTWSTTFEARHHGVECPYCSGRKLLPGFNDLKTLYPEIAAELHPTKNGNFKAEDIYSGTGTHVWWRCSKCGNEWQARVSDRTNKGYGCKICKVKEAAQERRRKKIKKEGSFAENNPELLKEWDYQKNSEVDPTSILSGSHSIVWWKCSICGYEWQAAVCDRSLQHKGCKKCGYKKAAEKQAQTRLAATGSLANEYPFLLTEWDYDKNYPLTPETVAPHSQKNVWWKCQKCGHEWKTRVSTRTKGDGKGTNCPECARKAAGGIYPGKRYGKLVAVQPTGRKRGANSIWEFKCDCGNIVERSTQHLTDKASCGCAVRRDITGQRFGRLTAIRFVGKNNNSKENLWLCRCDCGNEVEVTLGRLSSGNTKSCGCLKKEFAKQNNYKYENLVGKRFGILTVTEELGSGKQGVKWLCKCDCGNEITASTGDLTSGKRRSCGCVDNRLYCVYKHVSPDGKVYVGTTMRKPHTIWFNGHLYNGQYAMNKAITEIGGYEAFKTEFKHYYLDENESWVEAEGALPFEKTNVFSKAKAGELHKKYIKNYNSTEPEFGYNSRTGGFKDYTYTDDVRTRQSKTRTGEDNRTDWKVYSHTNKINGKVYVGISCREDLNDRWQSGEGYKRPRGQGIALSHFYNAIQRYGWDSFDHRIIATNLTLEQASKLEQELIKEYDSTDPEKGYNVAKGGKGSKGAKHKDATKKLLSEKAKRRYKETGVVNFKGAHHTDETKKKLSAKAKKRFAETGQVNFKGKHHSDEVKRHLSDLRSKPITMYDLTGKIVRSYSSVSVAAEAFGVSVSTISGCAHGKPKTSVGHIWRFLDVDQLPKEEMPELNRTSHKR